MPQGIGYGPRQLPNSALFGGGGGPRIPGMSSRAGDALEEDRLLSLEEQRRRQQQASSALGALGTGAGALASIANPALGALYGLLGPIDSLGGGFISKLFD